MNCKRVMGMRSFVLKDLPLTNVIHPIADYDRLDQILNAYAAYVSASDVAEGRYLKVVSFTFVTHGERILTVVKRGVPVLGFGRYCCYAQENAAQSKKHVVIEECYKELDLYLPGMSYSLRIVGLLHSDDRQYDRTSIGCIFHAELNATMADKVLDHRLLTLQYPQSVSQPLEGWSRAILDHVSMQSKMPGGEYAPQLSSETGRP